MSSDIPCPQRWFDDYEAVERFTFGTTTIDEAEIIEFGRTAVRQCRAVNHGCAKSLNQIVPNR
ncbi:MAG: hypothetical protein OXI97_10925 [Acidimicrobiaceae bacterium]|nr:hypothetical protein [Acidimicrobiaceae bacterium]